MSQILRNQDGRRVVGPAFENGEPVEVVDFECPEAEPTEGDVSRARREAITRVFGWLVSGHRSPELIGRKALVVAWLLQVPIPGCDTPRDLARLMNLSPARVTGILNEIRAELAEIPRK